jgi:prolyl oligopeptidase
MANERCFYLRRDQGVELPRLVVRTTPSAPERVLMDPNLITDDTHRAIDWQVPSGDGKFVVYGLSRGGSEDSTAFVLDVETGQQLTDTISRVRFGRISWLEDSQGFAYHRYREPPAGTPPAERRHDSRACLHLLGQDSASDRIVAARALNPAVVMTAFDRPFLSLTPNSPWMVLVISHSALGPDRWSDCTLYVAPGATLDDPAACPWRRVAGVEDAVINFALDGDTLYALTGRDSSNYRVVSIPLKGPNQRNADVVIAESDRVIEDIRIVSQYLLVRDLDAGVGRIRRMRLPAGEPEDVLLPIAGTILEWAGDPLGTTAMLQVTSWTVAPQVLSFGVASSRLRNLGWVPPTPPAFADLEVSEAWAPAADGTKIPLSIIHGKGLKRDGNNRTLLTGYGSYGLPYAAWFNPTMLAWFELGGVWAIAHIRGGGEFGRQWHEAGRKLNKENTITDFIACADYLIATGFTRPDRLAAEGASAGGIPTGGALVRRPELWAAMVMKVAVTNALRSEIGQNGPINIPEFGSVSTEDGFRSLQIVDSYAKVRDGVRYPAVLLTAGLNDPRVDVWQAMKMAARLQAATASGKPVLLRVEASGGHGHGATRKQQDEELADELAFMLHQTDPGRSSRRGARDRRRQP